MMPMAYGNGPIECVGEGGVFGMQVWFAQVSGGLGAEVRSLVMGFGVGGQWTGTR